MKNACLLFSAITSTTPILPLLVPGVGLSEIWFSTVGPVLVAAELEVLLLDDFLPPPLSSRTATTITTTIPANRIAPPSFELRTGGLVGNPPTAPALAPAVAPGAEAAEAAEAFDAAAAAERSCRRCGCCGFCCCD